MNENELYHSGGMGYSDHATEEDIANVRDAAHIQSILPVVEQQMNKMKRAVENKALQAFTVNVMTPELAHNLWVEWAAYDRVVRNLKARVSTAGLSVQ